MAVSNALAQTVSFILRDDGRSYSKIDTSRPPAPGSPSLTALSDHELQFNCTASVDVDSSVARYKLYLGLADGGPYSYVWNINFAQFPYTITQLSDGTPVQASTPYYGKITAVDIFGNETLLASCTQVSDTTDAGAGGGEEPLFVDDFGYTMDKFTPMETKIGIVQAAGWATMKDSGGPTNNSLGANGYWYTLPDDEIPGHESTPSPSLSGRVMCAEALPVTGPRPSGPGQTDFYLQLGDGTAGSLPANFWCQMWILINRTGSQMSGWDSSMKFLYPLHAGQPGTNYPLSNTEIAWLINGDRRIATTNATINQKDDSPEEGALGLYNQAGASQNSPLVRRGDWQKLTDERAIMQAHRTGFSESGSTQNEIAHNSRWIRPNAWQLIKFNIDISTTPGRYRFWKRGYGFHASGFKLLADFPETQTGLTSLYDTVSRDWPGPKTLRFLSTIGKVTNPVEEAWLYFAGFEIANSEAGLRTYGSF